MILTAAFVLGAFVLTTVLFKAIGKQLCFVYGCLHSASRHHLDCIFATMPGGYRAANTSKLQLRTDTGTTTVKTEEAESEKYECKI